MGPYHLGNNAAAINVANQDDRHIGSGGKPHVCDISVTQVHLGGATCPFNNHRSILLL